MSRPMRPRPVISSRWARWRRRRRRPLRIHGVGADSIQGDIRFIDAARQMGAGRDSGPNWLQVSGPRHDGGGLQAIDLDCNHIPDAAMTLAVMACTPTGTSTLRNIASWRVKETDRIAAMACELRKLGATVEEGAGLPPHDAAGQPCRTGARLRPHLRRPPHGDVPCRWRRSTRPGCRCASRTRSVWPRPSRTISRRCSRWCRRRSTVSR
jgi:hypothetical protein